MNCHDIAGVIDSCSVGTMMDLFRSDYGSPGMTLSLRIYGGAHRANGCGTTSRPGCGGCGITFPSRDDMKIFDGCADDLQAEQSR